MSARVVQLVTMTTATEVPAIIAGSVNLMRFSEALAVAGIVGRFDSDRGVLVIEPAEEPRAIPMRSTADLTDALTGMAWFNALSREERAYWLEAAGSAVPADAWRKFQSGYPPP